MSKSQKIPEALKNALSACDALIGPEQLEYFYNLYDPKTGGFYYSISSRDCEEMTPFAEGTCFVIEALLAGGMTLPDWYKEKVSEWILGHQDKDDGFFYEDLWGKITSKKPGARLYRDLAYSEGILEYCGNIKPRYPLPSERIKENKNEVKDNDTLPEYLESEEKMLAYLDSLDWSTKMIWGTGQALGMAGSLIKSAGLYDVVYEYVKKRQNLDTGLWGEGLDWMNTNGAMKLSHFFVDDDHIYPNAHLAVESVLKLFAEYPPPEYATYLWNPLVLLSRILLTSGERTEELRALITEKGPDIVNCAVSTAMKMHREDGGFASGIDHATPHQQGYIFGLGTRTESDLDGTLIAGYRLRNTIHMVFDVEPTRDYYAKYNDEFWERLKNKPPVVKTLPPPEGPLCRR